MNEGIFKSLNKLIFQNTYLNVNDIYPHERVIDERKKNLILYIKSGYEEVIIPSIIVCSKSNVIIDGHHRYFALKELGYSSIPVTRLDYENDKIITHFDPSRALAKWKILDSGLQKKMLSPKSSIHRIRTSKNSHIPIILLSKLSLLSE